MLSCWIKKSLSSVLRNPLDTEPEAFGTLAQVLSFDEERNVMVLHDSEYLVSAILNDNTKWKIIQTKADSSQVIPHGMIVLKSFCYSKANIMDSCGSYNSNFILIVQDADMVKYGRDEEIQGNPVDLMSCPMFATTIQRIPYGILGLQEKTSLPVPFFTVAEEEPSRPQSFIDEDEGELINSLFLDGCESSDSIIAIQNQRNAEKESDIVEEKKSSIQQEIVEDTAPMCPPSSHSIQQSIEITGANAKTDKETVTSPSPAILSQLPSVTAAVREGICDVHEDSCDVNEDMNSYEEETSEERKTSEEKNATETIYTATSNTHEHAIQSPEVEEPTAISTERTHIHQENITPTPSIFHNGKTDDLLGETQPSRINLQERLQSRKNEKRSAIDARLSKLGILGSITTSDVWDMRWKS